MKLSILICSVQKRLAQFSLLAEHLEKQAQNKSVEILWLGDNKTMSVGEKRNKLVSLAKGEYICFVDDDDWVADDYVDLILQGIEQKTDCVCFNAIYTNEKASPPCEGGIEEHWENKNQDIFNFPLLGEQRGAVLVDFSLKHILNVNEPGKPRIRVPNHLIPIKREFVLATKFLEKSFGEDTDYSLRVRRLLKTEYKIEKQLYHYRFSEKNSETHRFSPWVSKVQVQRHCERSEAISVLKLGLPRPSDDGLAVTGISSTVVMDIVIVSDATIGALLNLPLRGDLKKDKFITPSPLGEGWDGAIMTQQCINSVAADNVNIIVLEKAERVKYKNADTFLQRQPFNYNQCLNDGALFGNAELICFSNNDVVFPKGFVERVLASLNPSEGGTPESNESLPSGGEGWAVLSFPNQFGFMRADIISGFCFVMRRSAWNKIGKLNTNYKFWCADNVTSEQIKQHGLREGRSDIRVHHIKSVTLNKLNASTREEFTRGCVKQFNKDYEQNVLGIK